jgi:16S rRNA (guanine527-N7)-methyltransferase
MFHVKPQETERAISQGAENLGVELPAKAEQAMRAHLEMVMEAAQTMNLTAIGDLEAAIRLHVVDSLSAAPLLKGASELVDLGSGAGYPGIPVAAALECPCALVESREKRAAFLREVAGGLAPYGMNVSVVRGRAEDAASLRAAGRFDAVVARAVASLPTLVELAALYLVDDGRFVAMKGSPDSEELARGHEAGRLVGLECVEERRLRLPGGSEARTLIVYVRTGEPTLELPRRIGMATKRPLA